MPTESPRVNHNTGPPSVGQSPQPGQRLPTHPVPPHHVSYGQIPANRVGPHQQPPINHAPNRPLSSPQIQYMSPPPPPPQHRPMTTPPPAQQIQQSANRPPVTQTFFNNFDYTAMPGQPAYPPYVSMQYPYAYPVTHSGPPAPHPMHTHPMNGARQQRPPPPPSTHNIPRPQSQPPLPLPRRRTKRIAIVDPDTKQEIKPEKAVVSNSNVVPPKTTQVKIERPVSRPLQLVADPADTPNNATKSSESTSTSTTTSTELLTNQKPAPPVSDVSNSKSDETVVTDSSKPLVENTTQPTVDKVNDASVSAKEMAERIPSVSEPSTPDIASNGDESNIKKEIPESKPVVNPQPSPNDKPALSSTKADDNLDGMTSDVSSSTFADVRSDSTDGPSPNLTSKISDEQPSSVPKTVSESVEGESTPPQASEQPVETEDASTKDVPSKSSKLSTDVETPDEGALDSSKAGEDLSDNTPDNDDTDDVKELVVEEPKPTVPSMVFKPGERRVYPPKFMLSMREYANEKKSTEYIAAMTPTSLVKDDTNIRRNSSRDGHASRTGSGIMNSDPRGRAFPSAMQSSMQFTAPRVPVRGPPLTGHGGVGSDAFDLHKARSQGPPFKSVPSNRDGDPRGSRIQGGMRGGRHGGPIRASHTPIDPFIQQPPVEKLKRSENAWKVRDKDSEDETTRKVKEVRSLLNKLTLEKFDRIFNQIVSIDVSDLNTLTGIVKEIFEKPLYEPKFSSMYAELCRRLDDTIQPVLDKKSTAQGEKDPDKRLNFRRILLNNCKEEFVRFASSTKENQGAEEKDKTDEKSEKPEEHKELTPLEKEEEEMKAMKAKRRMLANVRFIGELYLKDLLRESIIHKNCIRRLLLLAEESFEEEILEAVCKLISKTGSKLAKNLGAADHIDNYFARLKKLSKDKRVLARIRFMIQDLVEQRENDWKVRREEAGAKTIAEIHKDIEEKEKAKMEASNVWRDRKQRNQGQRMDHNRGGMGAKPHVAMTMASAPRSSSSGMTRMRSVLERHTNRQGLNTSTSMQSMRFGPGGKSSLSSSTSGTSLRPTGSSGSRFSALISDPERSSASNANSADSRRAKTAPIKQPVSSALPRRTPSRADPPSPKIELMEISELKRKTKSIFEEYLGIESLEEFTACMEEEVLKPNYPRFIELVVKLSLEGKKDSIPKIQKLVTSLLKNGSVPAKFFLDAFEKFGPELSNIEVDFPLATELYSGVVAAAAATDEFKALEDNGEFGIGFIGKIFSQCTEKNNVSKLVVMTCAAIYQRERGSSDESESQKYALSAYNSLNIDLSAEMTVWDSMMGPRMLNRALDRTNMSFLIPLFPLELEVRSVLEGDPSEEGVLKALNSSKVNVIGDAGVDAVKLTVRVGLDVVFVEASNAKSRLDNILKKCVGGALLKKFNKGGSMPRDHQFAAICAVQSYFTRNESKLPATIGDETSAYVVFETLYEGDVVVEDVFKSWKDDTGVTLKMAGKEKLLMDTSRFFTWLDTAEEE